MSHIERENKLLQSIMKEWRPKEGGCARKWFLVIENSLIDPAGYTLQCIFNSSKSSYLYLGAILTLRHAEMTQCGVEREGDNCPDLSRPAKWIKLETNFPLNKKNEKS